MLLLFPAAGVVAIVIAVFLLAVFTLLVIRKCIMVRSHTHTLFTHTHTLYPLPHPLLVPWEAVP